MIKGFKEFLLKYAVVGLAIAVIIGGAIGKVVSSMVADILMPIISLAIPGGEWRNARLVLSSTTAPDGKTVVNAINYGTFLGNVIDFIIIALFVYLITKAFLKEAPVAPTKVCPKCTETIPAGATRCKYCTSELAAA